MNIQKTKLLHLAICCISGLVIAISTSLATAQEDEGRRRGRGESGAGDGDRGERDPAERGGFRGRGFRGGPGGPGQGGPGQGGPEMLMRLPIIAVLDVDRDGVISETEIAGAVVALKKLDRNKDGKIDMEEMRPRRGGPGSDGRGPGGPGLGGLRTGGDREFGERPGRRGPRGEAAGGGDTTALLNRMMEMDKDGDGFLSGSEVRENMKPMIERADQNNDGKLSQEELKKALESRAAMMRRGGGGGGPRSGGNRGSDAPGGERPRRPPSE